MTNWVIELLMCPHCKGEAEFEVDIDEISGDDIIKGYLSCPTCARVYPITNGIPRFVDAAENYAENFGNQWLQFRTTQIDRLSGHNLSKTRLLNDTHWSSEWMHGKLILDAGCGAGRFADELAQHGANVVACDLSSAVEACKQTIDHPEKYSSIRGKVAIIQANLLLMPFKLSIFDAIHCAGTIQHTPDPELVIRSLPAHLKTDGRLFYNFYETDLTSNFQVIKYLLRRWTPNWQMRYLVTFSRWMCGVLFFPSWVMSQIPLIRFFNRFLPICSVHSPGLPLRQQFDQTLLDTVDWYGPRYEIRQDHKEVAALLVEEGLDQVEATPGLAWAVKR